MKKTIMYLFYLSLLVQLVAHAKPDPIWGLGWLRFRSNPYENILNDLSKALKGIPKDQIEAIKDLAGTNLKGIDLNNSDKVNEVIRTAILKQIKIFSRQHVATYTSDAQLTNKTIASIEYSVLSRLDKMPPLNGEACYGEALASFFNEADIEHMVKSNIETARKKAIQTENDLPPAHNPKWARKGNYNRTRY